MPAFPLFHAQEIAQLLPRRSATWVGAGLLAILSLVLGPAGAQTKPATPTTAPSAAKQAVSKPLWRELTARQQRALEPLAPHWDGLTEPHKRKWLAISRNYAALSPAEQEMLHSRMTEWASLSNQQRIQARFNFAEVNQVPIDERKAKWEAYQALSEEEKRKLAARAAPRPGAAATIRPVPEQKLAPLPALTPDGQHTPRIQLAPPPASPRPLIAAPVPTAAPAFPPVSAEAQVPPPSSSTSAPVEPPAPPVRISEQPASAP